MSHYAQAILALNHDGYRDILLKSAQPAAGQATGRSSDVYSRPVPNHELVIDVLANIQRPMANQGTSLNQSECARRQTRPHHFSFYRL